MVTLLKPPQFTRARSRVNVTKGVASRNVSRSALASNVRYHRTRGADAGGEACEKFGLVVRSDEVRRCHDGGSPVARTTSIGSSQSMRTVTMESPVAC